MESLQRTSRSEEYLDAGFLLDEQYSLQRIREIPPDEASFLNKRGYRFMRLEVDGGGNPIYSISWNDLVTLLECPVIDVLRVRSQILAESTQQSDNKKNII